ncbi:MAG: hypothetical protein HY518_00745 [Candidatus Aenigmarchaeota archaeon]|nr:hypothetical protein [Candidatus Aenigmarchaeota archaeon]
MRLNIFRRQTETPAAAIERVPRDSLAGWFASRNTDRMMKAAALSRKLSEDITYSFRVVGQSLKPIEKISAPTDKRLDAAIRTVRDPYISRARNIISRLPVLPPEPAYGDIADFHDRMKQAYAELGSMSPKMFYVLTNMFEKEGSALAGGIKQVGKSISGLASFLGGEARILKAYGELQSSLREAASISERQSSLSAGLEDLKRAAQKARAELDEAASNLDKLSTGDAAREYENLALSADEIGRQMLSIKNNITLTLSIIRKPLERLNYKTRTKAIKSYLDDPFSMLLEDEKSLGMITEGLAAAGVDMRQKDREKVAEFLSLQPSVLARRSEYMALAGKKEGVHRELEASDYPARKRKAEEAASYLRKEGRRLDVEQERAQNEITRLQARASAIRKNLEQLLSEATGNRIEIVG